MPSYTPKQLEKYLTPDQIRRYLAIDATGYVGGSLKDLASGAENTVFVANWILEGEDD